jgi:heptosyltransferase-2
MGQKDEVKFMGILPQEKRQELYHSHDIFISPSHKDDAYTRSLLEAMSSGMAIVSTWTASKSEFLEERVNAMLYPKGDSDGCADQIQCLSREPLLFESITKNARKTVENSFPLNRTVDSIEQFLFKIAKQAKPVGAPIKTHGDIRLDRLTRRAKRWLILGKCVVFTRILLQPKFFLLIPVKIYKKLIGFTPHFLYKTLFDMCFFWKRRHRQKTASSHRHTQRMLVLQLADIGDVVLTSPFLRELRRCYPEAWISLVVQPGMHNLVEKCPYIDDIIPYDWGPSQKREKYLRGSPLWWIQATGIARKNLWKHPLDTAISNRWNEDPCQAASLILMYTSGASRRVAYRAISSQKMRYGWRDFDRLITEGPVREIPKHEVEQQLDVLRYLGAEPEDTRLEVWISHEDKGFARKVLHESQIDQTNGLIAFAPGAAWVFRRWPAERFIELGKWLQDTYNVSVLIFAAKIEEDLACRVEKGLRKEKTLNLAGKTTLREMAAFFKHCKLFIGNDSGPLHIATAAGIPVIGFYGPGEYHRFKPWGKNQEALRLGLSCSPCSQNCLFDEPRCIRGITFDQVKNLLVQKMSSILDLP